MSWDWVTWLLFHHCLSFSHFDFRCLIVLFLFQSSNGDVRAPFPGGVKPPMATQHQTGLRGPWAGSYYQPRYPQVNSYNPSSNTSATYTSNSVSQVRLREDTFKSRTNCAVFDKVRWLKLHKLFGRDTLLTPRMFLLMRKLPQVVKN